MKKCVFIEISGFYFFFNDRRLGNENIDIVWKLIGKLKCRFLNNRFINRAEFWNNNIINLFENCHRFKIFMALKNSKLL